MTLEAGLMAAFRYTVTSADTAALEGVAGRRLQFAVRVQDGGRLVARGMITRVVVDTAAFLGGAGAEAGGGR
jgi:predicted thioesterase